MNYDPSNIINKFSGSLCIDRDYAINALCDYLDKINLLENKLDTKSSIFSNKVFQVEGVSVKTGASLVFDNQEIAQVTYSGVMTDDDGWCNYGIKSLAKGLYSLYDNPNVKGIILNLDSGGGEESSAGTLYAALADKNKPVVVHTPFLGSAAVWGTLTATEVIAMSDVSKIGSIGSYISLNTENIKKYTEAVKEIYAEQSADKNKAFRMLLEDNFEGLQSIVNESADLFIKAVEKHRKLNPDTKEETLKGGVFRSQDAKARGLVHSVGGRVFAIKRVKYYIDNNIIKN